MNNNNKPQLELCSVKFYTEKNRRIYTNRFYKNYDYSFGIEIKIRNNSRIRQDMRLGGCIYDEKNNTVAKWFGTNYIKPLGSYQPNFHVSEQTFSSLRVGRYEVRIWINDTTFQRDFTIENKQR